MLLNRTQNRMLYLPLVCIPSDIVLFFLFSLLCESLFFFFLLRKFNGGFRFSDHSLLSVETAINFPRITCFFRMTVKFSYFSLCFYHRSYAGERLYFPDLLPPLPSFLNNVSFFSARDNLIVIRIFPWRTNVDMWWCLEPYGEYSTDTIFLRLQADDKLVEVQICRID